MNIVCLVWYPNKFLGPAALFVVFTHLPVVYQNVYMFFFFPNMTAVGLSDAKLATSLYKSCNACFNAEKRMPTSSTSGFRSVHRNGRGSDEFVMSLCHCDTRC